MLRNIAGHLNVRNAEAAGSSPAPSTTKNPKKSKEFNKNRGSVPAAPRESVR
jgi:hypothetical protein